MINWRRSRNADPAWHNALSWVPGARGYKYCQYWHRKKPKALCLGNPLTWWQIRRLTRQCALSHFYFIITLNISFRFYLIFSRYFRLKILRVVMVLCIMLCNSAFIIGDYPPVTVIRPNWRKISTGLADGFCKMRRAETKMIDANAVILLNVLKLNYTRPKSTTTNWQ